MANKPAPESRYFLTELNDGIQWLTDGQDFGMHPAAAQQMLRALESLMSFWDHPDPHPIRSGDKVMDEVRAAVKAAKGGVTQRRRVDALRCASLAFHR